MQYSFSMKPDYKPLKELSGGVTKYKTKVRVLHKGYPQKSPKKESRYQRLILEDDEVQSIFFDKYLYMFMTTLITSAKSVNA